MVQGLALPHLARCATIKATTTNQMHDTLVRYGSVENAVCALIDDLDTKITRFEALLERHAEEGISPFKHNEHERLKQYSQVQIARLYAVMQVHHDVLDACGKTSYLIKATETVDRICVCLDILDVLSSIAE